MMRIDEVLCALVYRRSFRARFRAGARTELGIDPADVDDLGALDLDELERAATLTCEGLLDRAHRGVGSLREAFPRSIGAYCTQFDEGAVAMDFAESEAFAAFRGGLGAEAPGPPLEATFGDFLEGALAPEWQSLAREERALAVLRALLVTPAPAFAVPDWVRATPAGHCAIVRREGAPLLVAALHGRLVTGPVTPLIAEILEGGAEAAAVVRAELRAMGLLS